MTYRFDLRGWTLGAAVIGAALVGGVLAHASGDTAAPSADLSDRSTDHVGSRPAVSDDGRWVVFEGAPPLDDGRTSTVWLVDRSAPSGSAPTELTVADERLRAGDSVRPAISGDGCVVAVVTQIAYDLFRDDDTGARWDVYRLVLPHCGGRGGEWELVSTTSSEGSSASASDLASPEDTPALSWSGTTIAYAHGSQLDPRSIRQLSVVDLTVAPGESDRVTSVPGLPDVVPDLPLTYRGQSHPDLSDDGQVVVFATDLTSAEEPGALLGQRPAGSPAPTQVYRWQRGGDAPSGGLERVSSRDGQPAQDGASAPAVSADGRFVVFESPSTDLLASSAPSTCTTACPPQVFRFDAQTGELDLASGVFVAADGGAPAVPPAPLAGGAWAPAISADGTQIAFVTRDRNVFAVRSTVGADPDDGDVAVVDLERRDLVRVTLRPDAATPLSATNARPAMSASGHVVVFDTLAAGQLEPQMVLSGDATGGGRHVATVDRPVRLVPAALDVGTVRLGVAGPEWYGAIRNEGPATFVPTTVVSADPRFAVTGGTCALGLPVRAGTSCTVYVTLTPDTPGPVASTITVSDTRFGGGSASLSVSGAGGEPMLDPTPAGADFAPTMVGGTSLGLAFDIANIGFQPDGIVAIELGGRHPGDFDVPSTSCSGTVLYPTTSCAIEVRFRPTEAGYRSAVATLTSASGARTSVVLSGIGTRVVTLVALDSDVRPGRSAEVSGSGFPAGAAVTLAWSDGRGEPRMVTAADDGSFTAAMPTRVNDRPGPRTLVATSADLSATVTVEVLRRRSSSPFGT